MCIDVYLCMFTCVSKCEYKTCLIRDNNEKNVTDLFILRQLLGSRYDVSISRDMGSGRC